MSYLLPPTLRTQARLIPAPTLGGPGRFEKLASRTRAPELRGRRPGKRSREDQAMRVPTSSSMYQSSRDMRGTIADHALSVKVRAARCREIADWRCRSTLTLLNRYGLRNRSCFDPDNISATRGSR